MDAQPVEKLSIACFEAVSPDIVTTVFEFQEQILKFLLFFLTKSRKIEYAD